MSGVRKRYAYTVMVVEPEGNRSVRRSRRRWEDITELYLK
jgi:hypothetical protein